jgi:hypothetical protein
MLFIGEADRGYTLSLVLLFLGPGLRLSFPTEEAVFPRHWRQVNT